jgi:HrpA-like RNA helicase
LSPGKLPIAKYEE